MNLVGAAVLLGLTVGCFQPSPPPCVNGVDLGERVFFQVVEPFDETSRYLFLEGDRRSAPSCGLPEAGMADLELGQLFEFRADEIYGDNLCVVYRCPDSLPTSSIESLNGGRAPIGTGGATLCLNSERDVDLGGGCIARRGTELKAFAAIGMPRVEGARPPTVFTRILRREAGDCAHVPGLRDAPSCIDKWVVDTVAQVE